MLLAMTRCRSARSTNPFDWKSKALVRLENMGTSTNVYRALSGGLGWRHGAIMEISLIF